jgi:hypothetical protein
MGRGSVAVLVVAGLFVLLPLWFAWLSLDARRWQRVERILGREPPHKEPPRWLWWLWAGLCAAYVVLGVVQVASGRERVLGIAGLVQGVGLGLLAGFWYLRWRRRERERAGPGAAGAQVERGPPGRPGGPP